MVHEIAAFIVEFVISSFNQTKKNFILGSAAYFFRACLWFKYDAHVILVSAPRTKDVPKIPRLLFRGKGFGFGVKYQSTYYTNIDPIRGDYHIDI